MTQCGTTDSPAPPGYPRRCGESPHPAADSLGSVKSRELSIEGAWEFEPAVYPDDRGHFVAPFQAEAFRTAVGHTLNVAQTNHSVSRRGVVRGVHFADVPVGQAKYVYCGRGSLLDVIVDVRVGSPTFGAHEAVLLESRRGNAVYLSEGLGHAFVALDDDTAMVYLCSTGYNPGSERGVNPLDPALELPWPSGLDLVLSDKDRAALSVDRARSTGLLPDFTTCVDHRAGLRDG